MNRSLLLNRIWKLLCSLKLAIVLASAATLLIMGGSLLIPFNPRIFGHMDALALGDWLRTAGAAQPALTWWVFAAGALMLLLGLNTLCCFIDWARNLRARWRKSGEYLIHLGFVLVLAAYVWGSLAGFRSEGNRIFVGEVREMAALPGYYLRLDAFEPQLGASGRPVDMLSTVTLLRGDRVLSQGVVKTNTPLTRGGLIVVPSSFGRQPAGFNFFLSGLGAVPLTVGSQIELGGGRMLRVIDFYADASRRSDDQAVHRGDELGNPAIRLELLQPGREPWRGWYFLRGEIPYPLVEARVRLWPTEPLYRVFSVLTVNYDPGAPLAMVGATAMLAGVLLAAGSFYYKRGRGDRPEVV
jgi:cytochrome c biogenesis protein